MSKTVGMSLVRQATSRVGRLRRGRAQPGATRAHGAQPLAETGPGPRLQLRIAVPVLASRRLEVLEPGVRLLDLQQFLGVLGSGHHRNSSLVGWKETRTETGRTAG